MNALSRAPDAWPGSCATKYSCTRRGETCTSAPCVPCGTAGPPLDGRPMPRSRIGRAADQVVPSSRDWQTHNSPPGCRSKTAISSPRPKSSKAGHAALVANRPASWNSKPSTDRASRRAAPCAAAGGVHAAAIAISQVAPAPSDTTFLPTSETRAITILSKRTSPQPKTLPTAAFKGHTQEKTTGRTKRLAVHRWRAFWPRVSTSARCAVLDLWPDQKCGG